MNLPNLTALPWRFPRSLTPRGELERKDTLIFAKQSSLVAFVYFKICGMDNVNVKYIVFHYFCKRSLILLFFLLMCDDDVHQEARL